MRAFFARHKHTKKEVNESVIAQNNNNTTALFGDRRLSVKKQLVSDAAEPKIMRQFDAEAEQEDLEDVGGLHRSDINQGEEENSKSDSPLHRYLNPSRQ